MTDDGAVDVAGLGACPIPISDYPNVLLAHGGGGSLSQMLIEDMFASTFSNEWLDPLHDGAVIDVDAGRMAVSTDSFVISPLFFPGGDIGSLAVHGTVNDVAMCGATPTAITVGMVIEEGLSMEDLWRIVNSVKEAADEAGVAVATGDTKVVDRGKGDGIFINTTGFGMIPDGVDIRPDRMEAGDVVIVSGTIADHGIAIMSVREGLEFETALESDTASLSSLVGAILSAGGPDVHVLRDPTRGGVASATNEIAQAGRLGIRLHESEIPMNDQVKAACEILGFDPLYVANEGKCIAIVGPDVAEAVLAAMRSHPLGEHAAIIGEVVEDHPGKVFLRSRIGGNRVVDMLSGEQLPRIC
ncbi:MAG: hydrogenase expression/formation protein HypE [Acidimicrobiia bacterium]|nr:hydrogenase expression/formation protein HypE [Acidimicrobiia bacterium]